MKKKTLDELVAQFAKHVAAQTDELLRRGGGSSVKKSNHHAKRYIAAFDELRSRGDAGRDALASLFTHPLPDVRVPAAACLLRHRTDEAKKVLREAAKGEGLSAPGAQLTLENWEKGDWQLDPE